jgi:thiol-disulfide isomerase/thioredoxin
MGSLKAISAQHVVNTLEYCAGGEKIYSSPRGSCRDIVPVLIQVAMDANVKSACGPLNRLSMRNERFSHEAYNARNKMCI